MGWWSRGSSRYLIVCNCVSKWISPGMIIMKKALKLTKFMTSGSWVYGSHWKTANSCRKRVHPSKACRLTSIPATKSGDTTVRPSVIISLRCVHIIVYLILNSLRLYPWDKQLHDSYCNILHSFLCIFISI